MEEKAKIIVKDAASLNKTFHRLGFPQTAEVSSANRSQPEIRMTFEPKGEVELALLIDPIEAIAALEMSAPSYLKGQKKELPEMLISMRHVQWTNPAEHPKWDFAHAVRADLTSLKSLERSLCAKGDFCGYQLMHTSEDWFVEQVNEHSTAHYGDFCLVPTFTRSFLLFLKQPKHLGQHFIPHYEMHLWVFI